MAAPQHSEQSTQVEHVDLLIVGAGLSGIDAAATFRRQHPGKSIAILERRESLGGTWDLFRYPGIRSDSDMFTFAFKWRPWESDQVMGSGALIKDYLTTAAEEEGVDKLIRYGHKVLAASWDSGTNLWTVRAEYDGAETVLTARFLWSCSGYYDYDQGFQPDFEGLADFQGTFIHPQFWPEDLDYTGKKVVIIGSGATAVTLVPAMVDGGAEHVTMLQRTPTYILSRPGKDPVAGGLRKLPWAKLGLGRIPGVGRLPLKQLGARSRYEAIRWENIALSVGIYHFAKRAPKLAKKFIRDHQVGSLTARKGGAGFTRAEAEAFVDEHLTPPYNPWDQRLCAVPDGDLWRVLRHRRASIVTDRIERITATGVELQSGEVLEADVLISATGLNIKLFGGVEVEIDGEKLETGHRTAYKAALLSGVPNFAFTIGYINASWTLKADLVSEWFSKLVADMDAHGHERFVVREPAVAGNRPLMDMKSGYLLRGAASMPRQGDDGPWVAKQNYLRDMRVLGGDDFHDGNIDFA